MLPRSAAASTMARDWAAWTAEASLARVSVMSCSSAPGSGARNLMNSAISGMLCSRPLEISSAGQPSRKMTAAQRPLLAECCVHERRISSPFRVRHIFKGGPRSTTGLIFSRCALRLRAPLRWPKGQTAIDGELCLRSSPFAQPQPAHDFGRDPQGKGPSNRTASTDGPSDSTHHKHVRRLAPAPQKLNANLNPPQCRPPTVIGAATSLRRTKRPPPMSRR